MVFSLVGLDHGATINASTGVFTWMPTEAQGGSEYTFTVKISDGGLSDEKSFKLTVEEVNLAPVLSNVPASSSIFELSEYTFTAFATDADLPAQGLSFSLEPVAGFRYPVGASIVTSFNSAAGVTRAGSAGRRPRSRAPATSPFAFVSATGSSGRSRRTPRSK
jgi:hypothetical protein